MTINIWFNALEGTYNIRYNSKVYQRHSYIAAKEVIDIAAADMERSAKEERLNTLYDIKNAA